MSALSIQGRKVIVSREGVASFARGWPNCKLRDRSYWFEFDSDRNLIDTDVPEHDDGGDAFALSQDCEAYLFDNSNPSWNPS